MKKIFYTFLLTILFLTANAQDYSAWDRLLQKHVNKKGFVDYEGMSEDKTTLMTFLESLTQTKVDGFSKNAQLAYWINLYNAAAIYQLVANPEAKSINDIKIKGEQVWSANWIIIYAQPLSLNTIENEIIRPLGGAKIHAAVNCASVSCPKLLNQAFTEKNVQEKMELLMKEFINDTSRNKISKTKVELSQILNWYQKDFLKEGTLIDFINKYSEITVNADANISFLEYNWEKNKQ